MPPLRALSQRCLVPESYCLSPLPVRDPRVPRVSSPSAVAPQPSRLQSPVQHHLLTHWPRSTSPTRAQELHSRSESARSMSRASGRAATPSSAMLDMSGRRTFQQMDRSLDRPRLISAEQTQIASCFWLTFISLRIHPLPTALTFLVQISRDTRRSIQETATQGSRSSAAANYLGVVGQISMEKTLR